jgi:hypothetical protein
LQDKGVPGIVDRCLVCPPTSRIGPITPEERADVRSRSPIGSRYDNPLDRESAAEILRRRADQQAAKAAEEQQAGPAARPRSNRQSAGEAAVKSFVRSMSSMLGREIMRGLLGAMKKGN